MKAISGRFEMQVSPLLSLSPSSPSFNSYSSSNLAEIAARVVQELRIESQISSDSNIFDWEEDIDSNSFHQLDHQEEKNHYNCNTIKEEEEENNNSNNEDDEEDEFEFAFVCKEPDTSPISADEIFYNGQIKPMYPLFDTSLVLNQETQSTTKKSTRSPLGKLFSEERETTTSCSSSEADDLDGLNPGTYCVWTPKKAEESSGRCKKSNSTGSLSKRWKFKDFLHRSNSDGKETFVFLASNSKKSEVKANKEVIKGVEEHYVNNRAIKEGDKRKSFLPYKQDLMGFFGNVNGLSKNLHPF